MPIGDVSPEIALILTAVAVVLWAAFAPRRLQEIAATIALGGILVGGALLAGQVGQERLTFSGIWAIDAASVWARLTILAVTAAASCMAAPWMRTDPRGAEFHAILIFSALGAMAMAAAADLMQLVVAVLLSSATGYVLAAYHRDWAISLEAGMKYFLLGALANAILTIGVVLVIGMTGGTGYDETLPGLISPEPLTILGFALIVVGLAFKLGAVPGHAWVPDVAEGAPVPAAAFLTVVPKIGAAIALARLVSLAPDSGLTALAAAIAVATMTLGNLAALAQDDLRRLLGWSSVSQTGYALMAVAAIQAPTALPGLIIFLVGYAAGNTTAFAAVAHLRGRTAIADLAGLSTARPGAAAALVLSFLSLAGIPPVIGFVGKLLLFVAAFQAGYAWLAVAAAANTVASLWYYARILARAFFEEGGEMHVLSRWTAVAMWTAAMAIPVLALLTQSLWSALDGTRLLP